jgi:hypothetical protein
MAITDKTDFFQASLGEFADIARAYGVGKPIREIAASTPDVSLSTLKKLMNGEHIRAKQFHAAARAFNLRPLDWIELKIRYVEAYMQEYLFKDTEYRIRTSVDSMDIADFFQRRNDPEQQKLFSSREDRFSFFIRTHFVQQGVLPKDIADENGQNKKKDKHSASRQTINACRAGQHVRPNKFQRICRKLNIEKSERSIAKILYAEAYIGEFLLGEDPAVFKKLNFENYPRTSALLTYSVENRDVLP